MTGQDTNETVRRYFAAIDGHRFDDLDAVCALGYIAHFPGVPVPLDRASAKGLFAAFVAGFPDIAHRIDESVAEGDRVAVRLVITGTHRAEFNGIPATGKPVTIGALNLFRLDAAGHLAEHWIEYDTLGFLQQLGVAPVPAQTG
jgi:steroid delta-isomerase-like uncharacterized protein